MNEAQKIVHDVIRDHNEKVRLNESAAALLDRLPKMKGRLGGKGVSDFGGLLVDTFEELQALESVGQVKIITTPILSYDSGILNVFGSRSANFKHKFFAYYLPIVCFAWIIISAIISGIWWILFGLSTYFMASFFSARVNPLRHLVLLTAIICSIACIVIGGVGFAWLSWPGAYILMHFGYSAFRNNYRSSMVRAAALSELAFLMLMDDQIINAYWFPTDEDSVYRLTLDETPTRLPPEVRAIWEGK